jgi:hypothetical protein
MELLRRALLVGGILPGLWLLRLAPLDPLLTLEPVDFAAIRKAEAERVPDAQKTERERRDAEIPLPVYIEEKLQYNIFSATGPEWDGILRSIDELASGPAAGPENTLRRRQARRGDVAPESGAVVPVFFRSDEGPMPAVLDRLGAGGGTTYISMSRPGEDRHYRVERRTWTRRDFRPGAGFSGRPAPPDFLLYPFRWLGIGSILAGLAFFALLPASRAPAGRSRPTAADLSLLAAGLALFAVPLFLVGGSVQAWTQTPWLAAPCWFLAGVAVHLFAAPRRHAPEAPPRAAPEWRPLLFLREGLAFLAIAFGPLLFLISASLALWNR